MRNSTDLKRLIYIYERVRDQQEFISDLTILVVPLLKSLSESCPHFDKAYRKNAGTMQPKVIRAKLDSLRALDAEIRKLKADAGEI